MYVVRSTYESTRRVEYNTNSHVLVHVYSHCVLEYVLKVRQLERRIDISSFYLGNV